ncbi:MAG: MFS transporter [Candidatus Thorarchaeota archaeon]|jgi:MFS family permease
MFHESVLSVNVKYQRKTQKQARIDKSSFAVLVACFLAHLMNHVHTGVVAPFLPVISGDLNLSFTEAGAVASTVMLTQGISHFGIGFFVDRGWGNIFIPTSILLGAIIVLVTCFATTFVYLVFCMVLLGIGVSPYHPSAFPALAERFPQSERAMATGIQSLGDLIGNATIPIIGVMILGILASWRMSMFILGIIGIAVFIPAFLLMNLDTKGTGQNTRTEVHDGTEDWSRDFILVLIVMGLRSVPFRCTTLLMPLYLVSAFMYEPFWAGVLTTLMLVAGVFGQLVGAPLSDRLGKRVPFIIMSTGIVAPCLVILTLSIEFGLLIIVLTIIGFSFFFGVPSFTAYMTEVSPVQKKGLAFGILFSIGTLPGAISPIIFGVLGDVYGLSASILFLAILALLASIEAFFMTENTNCSNNELEALYV